MKFLRAKQIHSPYGLLPISRSKFWKDWADGRIPSGTLVSPRVRVWTLGEILKAYGLPMNALD